MKHCFYLLSVFFLLASLCPTAQCSDLLPNDLGEYELYLTDLKPHEVQVFNSCGVWCGQGIFVQGMELASFLFPFSLPNLDALQVTLLYARHHHVQLDLYKKRGSNRHYLLSLANRGFDLLRQSYLVFDSIHPSEFNTINGIQLHQIQFQRRVSSASAFQFSAVKKQAESSAKKMRMILRLPTLEPWFEMVP